MLGNGFWDDGCAGGMPAWIVATIGVMPLGNPTGIGASRHISMEGDMIRCA